MDAAAYLRRIGLPGGLRPTLADLHERHLLSVPFENLDIHRGVPIVLALDALYDKIVRRGRGGFCYGLNGLFAWLLRTLGYETALLAAEVARDDGTWGIPFDHLVLRVELERPWLCDVGFGDGFLYPVPLDGDEVRQLGERFAVREEGAWLVLLREGAPQYRFGRTPRTLGEFTGACRHHQTSPESTFTRGPLCSVARPLGRLTLTRDKLIEVRRGRRTETPVTDFDAALREHFGPGFSTATA